MLVTIRLTKKKELPSVFDIYTACIAWQREHGIIQWIPGVYPTMEVAEEAHAAGVLHGIFCDGILVGSVTLNDEQGTNYHTVSWHYEGKPFSVHTLAIHPTFMGKGVARAAMEFAHTLAKERGYTVMRLDTNKDNLYAQRLFLAIGYTFAGTVIFPTRMEGHREFYCYERML